MLAAALAACGGGAAVRAPIEGIVRVERASELRSIDPVVDSPEDRDEDCLPDALEARIAAQFRPYFVYDSREPARRAHEPVLLYRVTPERCGRPSRVFVIYASLYADDGGYVTSFFCGDTHLGDNERLRLEVMLDDAGRASLVHFGEPPYDFPEHPMSVFGGSHPVVFPSAGKHHAFLDTTADGAPSVYSRWWCTDGVDGAGARVLPPLAGNVGEPTARLMDDLTPFGFPGETAWGERPFCGGHGPACGHHTGSMEAVW